MWILMLGCEKLGSHPLFGGPFSKSRNCYVIFTSIKRLPSPLTESQHFFCIVFHCIEGSLKAEPLK